MEVKTQNVIVKSNRLIEAGYKLTLQEQRVILLCITKIKPKEQLEYKTFRISAGEYAEKFGVKVNTAYKELKLTINTLYDRNVKVYDRDANIESEFRWVQKKTYFNNEGYAEVTLTDDLIPLLSELKSAFTSYNLDYVASMKSVYAIRLYELFKQFGYISKRSFELTWLKERLQIEDIYSAFADLKRRVIDPALKDINKYSDLTVTYKLIKKGKKVIALEFYFFRKEKSLLEAKVVENEQGNNINIPLLGELKKLGVSEKQALELLGQYKDDRIEHAIEITKHNIETKQIKKSVSGFLISAIEQGYSSYEVNQKKENKLKAEKSKKIEEVTIKLKEFADEYKKFVSEYIDKKIEELSSESKQQYISELLTKADPATIRSYKTRGTESRLVYSMLKKFVESQFETEILTEQQFYLEKGINVEALKAELQLLLQPVS